MKEVIESLDQNVIKRALESFLREKPEAVRKAMFRPTISPPHAAALSQNKQIAGTMKPSLRRTKMTANAEG